MESDLVHVGNDNSNISPRDPVFVFPHIIMDENQS